METAVITAWRFRWRTKMADRWNRPFTFNNRPAGTKTRIRRHVSVCSNNTNSRVTIWIACLCIPAWHLTTCAITRLDETHDPETRLVDRRVDCLRPTVLKMLRNFVLRMFVSYQFDARSYRDFCTKNSVIFSKFYQLSRQLEEIFPTSRFRYSCCKRKGTENEF